MNFKLEAEIACESKPKSDASAHLYQYKNKRTKPKEDQIMQTQDRLEPWTERLDYIAGRDHSMHA
jgi:hypothetical protein